MATKQGEYSARSKDNVNNALYVHPSNSPGMMLVPAYFDGV